MNNQLITLDVASALQEVRSLREIIAHLRQYELVQDVDYGVIPGTGDKPTLLLPGMEKLMRALNAVPVYIELCVIRDYDKPLFHFEYECRLLEANSGADIPGGRGMGLCTSYETSFRWRWVQAHEVPNGDISGLKTRGGKTSEFKFAVEKAETSGQYGKPADYWQRFEDAIRDGTANRIQKKSSKGNLLDAYEIDMTLYRVPNSDVFDQVNAIMKRAKKRALGDAIKGAAAVSEFFSVDLEDMPGFGVRYGDVVEATFEEVPARPNDTEHSSSLKNLVYEAVKHLFNGTQHFENTVNKHFAALSGQELVDALTEHMNNKPAKAWHKDAQYVAKTFVPYLRNEFGITLEQFVKEGGKTLEHFATEDDAIEHARKLVAQSS